MKPLTRAILFSAGTILTFDAIAAVGSRAFGYPYDVAALGSYAIYLGAGFFGARAGRGVRTGVLTAAATGLVDSTLGWMLSSVIGPGRPPAELAGVPGAIAMVVVLVPIFAGVVGLLGAFLARPGRSRDSAGA